MLVSLVEIPVTDITALRNNRIIETKVSIMKMHTKIVPLLVLLCLFYGTVLCSNPESEIVQDPSNSDRTAGARSMPLQKQEGFPGLAVISDTYSTGVKVLRPVFTSFGIMWREVGSASGEERVRIRDRGGFVDVFSLRRNNRTSSSVPVDGGGKDRPDSVSISSPPIKVVSQASVTHGNEAGSAKSGTASTMSVGNTPGYAPEFLSPRRPAPLPGGQNSWSQSNWHGYGSYSHRRQSHRPNVSKQNTRAPYPASNAPGQPGRSPAPQAGSRVPPPRPVGAGTSSAPPTNHHRGLTPDSNFFAGMVNDFGFGLAGAVDLDRLRTNFVVSPISIFVAASILYMAAEGQTKAQLEQALGLNDYAVHDEHLHQGIADLLSAISPESDQLRLANGLFLGMNYSVEQPFREDVQKFYGAQLENLNFSSPEATSRAVNEWVAKSTANMITSMATPNPMLNGILLLNAIYFKGVWKTQFPMELTAYERFFTLDGQEKEIPLMSLVREKFPVFRSEEHRHTFIKLPYSGDQVSMIIALPFRHEDSPMPTMTDQTLCHVRDAMVEMTLSTVAVPKFRLDFHTPLKGPLTALGVRDVFGTSADFGKMRKQRDLFVNDILHKAVVDVNEAGTSASAATSVQFVPLSSYTDEFVANHPFAFYIVHEPSGLVLFYGKIFDLGEAPRAPAGVRSQNMRVPNYNSGGRMGQRSSTVGQQSGQQQSSRERNDS